MPNLPNRIALVQAKMERKMKVDGIYVTEGSAHACGVEFWAGVCCCSLEPEMLLVSDNMSVMPLET